MISIFPTFIIYTFESSIKKRSPIGIIKVFAWSKYFFYIKKEINNINYLSNNTIVPASNRLKKLVFWLIFSDSSMISWFSSLICFKINN